MSSTKSYLPDSDDGRAAWYNHFAPALGGFVGQCGITAVDVGNCQKDAAYWAFLVGYQRDAQRWAEAVTAHKNGMRNGLPSGTTGASTELPDAPTLPTPAPVPVAQGIFQRLRDLVARIKRASDYTNTIGEALGIEAPEGENRPPADLRPALVLRSLNAGHPQLRIDLDGAPLVEVFVDRGGGAGWVQLTITLRSEFTDMHPLPPSGTAQVWRYRAICRDANGPIGQMSEVLTVTVTGL